MHPTVFLTLMWLSWQHLKAGNIPITKVSNDSTWFQNMYSRQHIYIFPRFRLAWQRDHIHMLLHFLWITSSKHGSITGKTQNKASLTTLHAGGGGIPWIREYNKHWHSPPIVASCKMSGVPLCALNCPHLINWLLQTSTQKDFTVFLLRLCAIKMIRWPSVHTTQSSLLIL